ncbi:hypothetical protein QC589_02275 [Halomonas elongata]|uniref:hypothetical protein n=1 Tax=Halomonas elongata TaxID=2746 RepID=UPI0033516A63
MLLHVGASKCGSSALQSFLSENPVLEGEDGRKLFYGFLDNQKGLVIGEEVSDRAWANQRGYVCCPNAGWISDAEGSWIEMVREQIKKFYKKKGGHASLILSNEGWFHNPDKFDWLSFINKLDVNVEVVSYVRPPVEMMNSAWWQWGAWTSAGLGKYIRRRKPTLRWYDYADKWSDIDWVSNVEIIPLDVNVVEDFLEFCGVGFSENIQHYVNRGLPAEVLRLYQRHPELRPGPHDSKIDFVLSKYLKHGSPTPWVLERKDVESIIEYTRDSNVNLSRFVGEKFSKRMDNPAWWDPDHFSNKPVSSWKPTEPSDEAVELDELCAAMASVIYELDMKSR